MPLHVLGSRWTYKQLVSICLRGQCPEKIGIAPQITVFCSGIKFFRYFLFAKTCSGLYQHQDPNSLLFAHVYGPCRGFAGGKSFLSCFHTDILLAFSDLRQIRLVLASPWPFHIVLTVNLLLLVICEQFMFEDARSLCCKNMLSTIVWLQEFWICLLVRQHVWFIRLCGVV